MKRTLTAVAVMSLMAATALAQGTIDFRNKVGTIDAPVVLNDGTTKVAGATFLAQLYFGAAGTTDENSLTAVGNPAAAFRTGAGAGYWNYGTDFTRILTGITPGANAVLQVRVWNTAVGSTYDQAFAVGGLNSYGKSGLLTIATGGAGAPPSVPAALTGLTSIRLVPEPTTLALGAMGLAGLLAIRRRK